MAKKTVTDYAKEELDVLSERYKNYTEWGFSPDLQPVVDILHDAKSKMNDLYNKLHKADLQKALDAIPD